MKKEDKKRMVALTQMAQGTLKVRAKRKKETKPREQPERELRNEVIKYLRKRGCIVKRLENGVWGKLGRGVPDLLFFKPTYSNCSFHPDYMFYFLELKSPKGSLSVEQKEFKLLCESSNIRHIVARSIGDIERAIL